MRTGRTCTVCASDRLAEVDEALLAGESTYSVATQFGLSQSAVARHAHQHLGDQLRRSEELRAYTSSVALSDRLIGLSECVDAVLTRAEQAGDDKLVLAGVEAAARLVERLHNLSTTADLEARIARLEQGGTHDDTYSA